MIRGQLLERVYRTMHDDVVDGVATGGSATTVVDTTLANKYPQNKFKNWIVFVSSTTDGLTPQSKYSIASAWTTAGTLTMATLTDQVGAGDYYSIVKGSVPIYTMEKLCNDALRMLGRIHYVDTSLTSALDTTRYTLPIATKGIAPKNVRLRDSDYVYHATPNWEIETAAPGSTETLVFSNDPEEGLTIVIDYETIHPNLTAYSSYVSETLHDSLVLAACMERAMWWKTMPKQRKIDVANWQAAKGEFEEAKRMYPKEIVQKHNLRVPINMFNS